MRQIIRGFGVKDCTEHLELHKRIDKLEKRLDIHLCDKHIWERYNDSHNIYFYISPPNVHIKCSKCGKHDLVSCEKWNDIQLDQALDKVESLGGEVTR